MELKYDLTLKLKKEDLDIISVAGKKVILVKESNGNQEKINKENRRRKKLYW